MDVLEHLVALWLSSSAAAHDGNACGTRGSSSTASSSVHPVIARPAGLSAYPYRCAKGRCGRRLSK